MLLNLFLVIVLLHFVALLWLLKRKVKRKIKHKIKARVPYVMGNISIVSVSNNLPILPQKKVKYIVNNHTIPCHFERYYYLKLGMALPIMRVDEDVLERHFHRKMFEQIEDFDAVKDLEAAQAFFNDLIQYSSNLN